LCLATDESGAIWFTTIARLRISSISVDIIIENELFACLYISFGEDAHTQSSTNDPFVNITVRIARVVAKATQITLLCRIDELAFIQGHEVEVFDAFLVILD